MNAKCYYYFPSLPFTWYREHSSAVPKCVNCFTKKEKNKKGRKINSICFLFYGMPVESPVRKGEFQMYDKSCINC